MSFYKARIGLLGGFVRSTVQTTGDAFGRLRSIDTDTNSFFVGAYSQYFLGRINLTTTLMNVAWVRVTFEQRHHTLAVSHSISTSTQTFSHQPDHCLEGAGVITMSYRRKFQIFNIPLKN